MSEIEKPLVSVLMTAYNREKYIAEAIESVLASTYTDFELIIVDDCSIDETVNIARKYTEKDKRVKLYRNEMNLGDYPNRNKAATYASGKYIKYVDSDDIIYHTGLEVFVYSMELYPNAALGICGKVSQDDRPYPYELTPIESYEYNFYNRGIFETGPSGLIFNAEKFRNIGGFSGKRFIGDVEINLKMAALWPIVVLPASLLYWRPHLNQEYAIGMNSTGYLELQLPLFKNLLLDQNCPLPVIKSKKIINYYRILSARKVLQIAINKANIKLAIKMYKLLNLRIIDLIEALFITVK